ncbi:MAG TPA: ferritin-like domain-containing protein [Micropepsaceae bacterium]|nr:ferritin-like domain-containing protein [Micropepsaceae bacterium]
MTDGTVYSAGWTLDDIDWSGFEPDKVDRGLLAAVKAASLVEYNAPDYVDYLKRVFRGAPEATIETIEHWGMEEIQHGLALARWANLADPSFDFEGAFARFKALYRPAHFESGDKSIRGSKRGEMIARCVVESGTSSYYSAMRDSTAEPVLKEVAGRIAADEFRHYRLFYEILVKESEPDLPIWRKLWVAATRLGESEDDELACAYYCANVPANLADTTPYERKVYALAYTRAAMTLYQRHHIEKLVKMVVKPAGLNPAGRVTQLASAALWKVMSYRGRAQDERAKAA